MTYIHAVNIGLAAAVICGIAAEYLYDRSLKAAFWWMLTFVALMLHSVASVAAPLVFTEPVSGFIAFAFSIMAISCLNVGIAQYFGSRVPWRLIDVVLVIAVVVNFVAGMTFPQSMVASSTAALLLAGAQASGIAILLGTKRGRRDRVFATILVLSTLNFASRPFIEAFAPQGGAIAMHVNNTLVMIALANLLMLRLATRLLKDMKGQSETDSLSGLFNRHGFQVAVNGARKLSQSVNPASLIICDLDHFKSINDEHGHYAGDRVIAAFGRLVRAGARDGDICGRVGGEEFCVYLHNSDARSARLFAEWLRVAFSSTSYPEIDGNTRFTASFGVTQVDSDESIEAAYMRADKALYRAKREGRNCVRSVGEAAELSGISFSPRPAG
ncbi:GGDEF domain-containing protein [Hoeflea poritis]|uniref:diguanylate cyclase n=1 Tax=Hoeflea poritis TaxID=2993659 RepID=A0ABT4VLH4_9HYPH|nr:GGDEF domain-containing protein [Hoeflea poritis]MDA4845568.1 GGDEF domain-containing protein [Hoeflea poritis]